VRGNEVRVEESGMVLLTKNRSIGWREIRVHMCKIWQRIKPVVVVKVGYQNITQKRWRLGKECRCG
jgi:hypothetical protein